MIRCLPGSSRTIPRQSGRLIAHNRAHIVLPMPLSFLFWLFLFRQIGSSGRWQVQRDYDAPIDIPNNSVLLTLQSFGKALEMCQKVLRLNVVQLNLQLGRADQITYVERVAGQPSRSWHRLHFECFNNGGHGSFISQFRQTWPVKGHEKVWIPGLAPITWQHSRSWPRKSA